MMAPPRQAIAVPESLIAGVSVLVVDDSQPIRDLLAHYFTKRNMTVTAVADGSAAIQTLERHRPKFDLVVTDLHMPGADGFAVLMEAKRANPLCAVVICTGYATLDSAIQAVRVGAYDYLTKPFNLHDVGVLLNRVATNLAWRTEEQVEPETPEPDTGIETTGSVQELSARIRNLEARIAAFENGNLDGLPTRG